VFSLVFFCLGFGGLFGLGVFGGGGGFLVGLGWAGLFLCCFFLVWWVLGGGWFFFVGGFVAFLFFLLGGGGFFGWGVWCVFGVWFVLVWVVGLGGFSDYSPRGSVEKEAIWVQIPKVPSPHTPLERKVVDVFNCSRCLDVHFLPFNVYPSSLPRSSFPAHF